MVWLSEVLMDMV